MKKYVFIETYIIPYLIPILLSFFISVIILLLLNRLSITIRDLQIRRGERKINVFLPRIIFGELSETRTTVEIEKFIDNVPSIHYWFKELLIKSLIEFKVNLRGLDNKVVHKIYEAFELNKHSCFFLKIPMIYFKKKGIYQLEKLDYKPAVEHIQEYMYHEDKKLRSNALMAYILLSERDISYLINTDYEFSFSEEIEILGICKMRKLKRPELLKDFLLSENHFIVRVGLHLAVYYNASDLETEITACIYHKNILVRKLAYIALGDLFLIDKSDELVKRYPEESEANRTIIIISLGKIGNSEHLDFLENILFNGNLNQLEIARAINSIDPARFSSLALNNQKVKALKKHIDEPLLK